MIRTAWFRPLRIVYWIVVFVVFVLAVGPITESGPQGSDKIKHFAAFYSLQLGAAVVYPRAPLWRGAVLLIAYGGAIELIQSLPIVHRDCSALDWLTDIAAIFCAIMPLMLSGLRARSDADKPQA